MKSLEASLNKQNLLEFPEYFVELWENAMNWLIYDFCFGYRLLKIN